MKRVLALIAAVAMVGGAFVLRNWLDDRDDTASAEDGESSSDEDLSLLCDPSLADYCEALAEENDQLVVEVEDSATASARFTDPAFSGRSADVDGWLVPAPLPAMVEETRQRAGLGSALGDPTGPLGRSPLVIAMWTDRHDALAPQCPDSEVEWRCIGDNAARPWSDLGGPAGWGRLEPGFEPPGVSALGLLVIGQASASFFETPEFASNDFDSDGFRGWLRNLKDSVPDFPATAGTPLDQMLAAGPAAYDLVGTTEAEAAPKVAASRDSGRLRIIYPAPMATADVLFAPVRGSDGADELRDLLESDRSATMLARAGWRVDGEPPEPSLAPDLALPDDNGLPRPGVLQALRNL